MGNNIQETIKDKIYSAESFIKAVRSLTDKYPLHPDEYKNYIDNDNLQINQAGYFLNAVTFEVIVKLFYEIEHQECCRKTHNLNEIYEQLSCDDQSFIKNEYDSLKIQLEEWIGQKQRKQANIRWCSLGEAISINKDIVTNYKYRMEENEMNSAFNNIIRASGTLYPLPYKYVGSFLHKLFERTKERNEPHR